jgi:transcriptional regulator with XRE-family HTH domain
VAKIYLKPLKIFIMKKAEFIKKLGLIVREARKAKELSIEELADKSKIAYSTLSCLERGIVGDIKSYNLYNIIQNLEIDPAVIFGKNKLTKDKVSLINKISDLDDKELKAFLELFKRLV